MLSQSEQFYVESAWKVLRNHESNHLLFIEYEKKKGFLLKYLFCRIFKRRIPDGEFWTGIRVDEEILCCRRDQRAKETYHHLFMSCPNEN